MNSCCCCCSRSWPRHTYVNLRASQDSLSTTACLHNGHLVQAAAVLMLCKPPTGSCIRVCIPCTSQTARDVQLCQHQSERASRHLQAISSHGKATRLSWSCIVGAAGCCRGCWAVSPSYPNAQPDASTVRKHRFYNGFVLHHMPMTQAGRAETQHAGYCTADATMNVRNDATLCCNSDRAIIAIYCVRWQTRYNQQPLCSDRVHTEYILLRGSMVQGIQRVCHRQALYSYSDHNAICSELTA